MKAMVPLSPVSSSVRLKVFTRDFFKCRLCEKSPSTHSWIKLQIDHILPKCKGGTNAVDNLQTLCGVCNNRKSGFLPNEFEERQKLKEFRKRVNIKAINYPAQTAYDRLKRLKNTRCIIHGRVLKADKKQIIYKCTALNCCVYLKRGINGVLTLARDQWGLLQGGFSFIPGREYKNEVKRQRF